MNQRLGTPSEPSAERVAELVGPLSRIPDHYRRFGVDRTQAEADLGITRRLQDLLVDAGVATVGAGDDLLFDSHDLNTVSLYLGLRSARRDAMHFWLRGLRRARSAPASYRVGFQVSCPVPPHEGDCRYLVEAAIRSERTLTTAERRGVSIGEVVTGPISKPELLSDDLIALIDPLRDVDFYFVPTFLSLDSRFVREARIGECGAVARILVEEATARGYEARLAHGFIASVPFSSPHTWAEIEVGGEWLPVDPLLPKALVAWGIARPGDWPAELSPRGLYHRITDEPARWACHGEVPAAVWLPTEVMR